MGSRDKKKEKVDRNNANEFTAAAKETYRNRFGDLRKENKKDMDIRKIDGRGLDSIDGIRTRRNEMLAKRRNLKERF